MWRVRVVAGGAGASDAPVSFTIRRVVLRWRLREDGSAPTLAACLRSVLALLGRDGRAFALVVDLPEAEKWCRAAAQAGESRSRQRPRRFEARDERFALLVAECSRATTESGLEKDVTVDARDLDQVFFVRHLKDGQHLVCLDLPTGKTAEEGLAQAISAVAQETVSVRAAIFWQHECLLYFISSLAAKGLAVRGARRVDIKESVAALEAGESPPMRLKSIHDSLRIMRPPVGKSAWDVI